MQLNQILIIADIIILIVLSLAHQIKKLHTYDPIISIINLIMGIVNIFLMPCFFQTSAAFLIIAFLFLIKANNSAERYRKES